ncbi:CarD family transcriptional regulator [Herbiconiux liukaitaii]|uniref:CarD family transcriptional regulator n=1 Tax=Herbiconiux liukaitaii TaxID=3342799 RepID=UPI0035B84BC3
MPFVEGQTVVHPFHGPLRVIRIADRTVRGVTLSHLQLRSLGHPLDVSVPVANADSVGIRPVASPDRIAELVEILRGPIDDQPMGWSRRIKSYQERVNTGDVEQLCYVVREVTRRHPKSSASSESQLLRSARSTLVVEFGLALGISPAEAEVIVDEAAEGMATASRR